VGGKAVEERVAGEAGFSLAVALLLVGIVILVIIFALWMRRRFPKRQ
jgi:hypothetical protein